MAAWSAGLALPLREPALAGGQLALATGRGRPGDDRVALTGPQADVGELLVVLVDRLTDVVGQVDHAASGDVGAEAVAEELGQRDRREPLREGAHVRNAGPR